ncbi:MAG: DUF4350 domain-containing protein [Actinobacteria bacterium]|nr:DUF4350 domain-containing protein [Actinomycetota bacterium]
MNAPDRRGRGMWIGVVVVVAALGIVVVWSGRRSAALPFDIGSSAPDGYRAIAILLREHGMDPSTVTAASLEDRPVTRRSVLVVPVPDLLDAAEQRHVLDVARSGGLVVLGSPRRSDGATAEDRAGRPSNAAGSVSGRSLADTRADPTRPGTCDIDRLRGLGPIDTAFAEPVELRGGEGTCYGDRSGSYVTEERFGDGVLVTLGSPYMWSNARLQPAKEEGGQPLDNASLALRLLQPVGEGADALTDVELVAATPTAGVRPNGVRSPLELLPTGVELALAQLVAAFVLYAWWRSRRLGHVVVERMPVEIAGSELVVAVGDLLRRRGSPARAAQTLRRDSCRRLARGLGLPADASTETIVAAVAIRTGDDPTRLTGILAEDPVDSPEALVRLAGALSELRQEVLSSHV